MRRLIVDMSSVVWRGLLAGHDEEFGYTVEFEGKQVKINSAQFGYENAMNAILGPMNRLGIAPMDVILVVEGMESKDLRRNMLESYKAKSSRAPEAYAEFAKCRDMLKAAFLDVGAKACSQDYLESDDVIAHLSKTLDGEKIILSEDGDLTILISESVKLWRKGELTTENPYGPFPLQYITLYKSLVGDQSDNIKGATRFGEKAFLDLYCLFGDEGLEALNEMVTCPATDRATKGLGLLVEDVGQLKSLQRIMDSSEEVYLSHRVAKLYPEQVDTRRKPLIWTVGMVKPLTNTTDERLRPFAGRVRLVHAENYDSAVAWATAKIKESDFVALDIETSTPPASDQWVEDNKKKSGEKVVDVFGSELTGMGLTFGNNLQYTLYFTHDHVEEAGVKNVTSEQCRKVVEICFGRPIAIQNVSFELTVLYQEWAEAWKDDPEWHGFIPNTHDTKIMGSYVNENISNSLKPMSKHFLGYDQQTYKEVCTIDGVERKMNELTANHVLHYGSDDTICTAALYSFFRLMMEREGTWEIYKEVEIYPAYLTALAFIQGADISMERLTEIIEEDTKAEEEAKLKLNALLVANGWADHACEVFETFAPAAVKAAFLARYGFALDTAVRLPAKMEAYIEATHPGLPDIDIFASAVGRSDVAFMNARIKQAFLKAPALDLDSPKTMKSFLYEFLGLPVRIINDTTVLEKQKQPDLALAVKKHKALTAGRSAMPLTDDEKELLKGKAKTDDIAIEFALLLDASPKTDPILKLIQTLKTVGTRRKLYYSTYPSVPHWKDGKVHASINQCATVTRRYSSSGPNLQQLPKKGEGVKFRGIFVPHMKDAVVCSIDFSGQELRLGAEASQDPNMVACFVGENKKDMHSLTAAGAMKKKWGGQYVSEMEERYGTTEQYDLFLKLRKSDDADTHKKADDLRKNAKNVNFGAQYDAQAPKLAETLIIPVADAQTFLEAKYAMFPRFEVWKDEVKAGVDRLGYASTFMGARRHLVEALSDADRGVAEKAKRQGPNFVIQGSSAEQTKLGMGRLWKSGAMFKYRVQFIAPIHDELVTSVHKDDALDFIKIKHECMVAPYSTMQIPVLGSISVGKNFADQHECGDWYIPENIAKELNSIFTH